MHQQRGFFGTIWLILRIMFGGLMLMSLAFLVIGLFASRGPAVPRRGVLHVKLAGPLVEHEEVDLTAILRGPLPTTLRSITDSIRRAAADERMLGVLLEVDAPEIGLAQLQELEDAMAVFRASGKWTCAFLETAGDGDRGNASYAAAILADKVVLSPPGDVNLVGIRAEAMFFAGLLEKLDVGVHFEQRYEYKNAANQFTQRAFTPAHRESTVALVDSLQGDLVRHIAARRKVEEAKAWEWIRGGPYLAQGALDGKMVDTLAYWDEVYAEAERLAGEDHIVELETYSGERKLYDSGPTIGVVTVAGAIVRGDVEGGAGMDSVGAGTIARALREARDAKVKGIVLRIDSPGGSYVASDIARREVEVTRNAGIPVIVSMGSVAASGGYFIAMDGDWIVAEPTTITGSIGVYAGGFAIRDALTKWLGITVDAYDSSPNAHAFSATEPFDATRVSVLKDGADRVYQDFVGKVAKRRKKEFAEIDAVAHGRVWSGRAALEKGLVDELGSFSTALSRVRERAGLADAAQVTLTDFPANRTVLDTIRDVLTRGSGAFATAVRAAATDAVVDGLRPPLRQSARELVRVLGAEQSGVMMALPARPYVW